MPKSIPLYVRRSCALSATLLSLLVAGCATTSPPSVPDCPTPSRPPALRQPMPSQAYSINVSRNIESWEKSLMGTPVMSKH